ncbi:hypothetical protein STEG23_018849, partial [Scotinomys teguina]
MQLRTQRSTRGSLSFLKPSGPIHAFPFLLPELFPLRLLFSSNMLKTYFSDVKFNRCITSQLIKWFSNFREFYYIQMEKYARQAINDGVTSTEELSITRDCELYRALNMHYNKANDFE